MGFSFVWVFLLFSIPSPGLTRLSRLFYSARSGPRQSPRKSLPLTEDSVGAETNVGFPTSYGIAGQDFPTYSQHSMPHTSFSCSGLVDGGLYADVSAQCQVYHMCADQAGQMNKFSFLCPNGTLFSQVGTVSYSFQNTSTKKLSQPQ